MFDRTPRSRFWFNATRAAVVTGLALPFGVVLAGAQNFPTPGDGGFNERDQVTGYLCVTPYCDVVRLPDANCICTKDNPAELQLSRLRLTCSTKEGGQWVACPIKPRYGNGG